jgi:hypothetical protein
MLYGIGDREVCLLPTAYCIPVFGHEEGCIEPIVFELGLFENKLPIRGVVVESRQHPVCLYACISIQSC